MLPRIGNKYELSRQKRLLVIGESHYFPEDSKIHHDAEKWYNSHESFLTDIEKNWVWTEKIVTESKKSGFSNRAHSIYRNISKELNTRGLDYDCTWEAIEHCVYYNFFQRPAKTGLSLELENKDVEVSMEVFEWILNKQKPSIVLFTSALAGNCAKYTLERLRIPFRITPHPGCVWWNRKAKKYGGQTGREYFASFLDDNNWLSMP